MITDVIKKGCQKMQNANFFKEIYFDYELHDCLKRENLKKKKMYANIAGVECVLH